MSTLCSTDSNYYRRTRAVYFISSVISCLQLFLNGFIFLTEYTVLNIQYRIYNYSSDFKKRCSSQITKRIWLNILIWEYIPPYCVTTCPIVCVQLTVCVCVCVCVCVVCVWCVCVCVCVCVCDNSKSMEANFCQKSHALEKS